MTEKAGKADEVTSYDDGFETLCYKVDQIKVVTERMLAQVESLVQPNPSELFASVAGALHLELTIFSFIITLPALSVLFEFIGMVESWQVCVCVFVCVYVNHRSSTGELGAVQA